jgi:menaquinone-dependent protoporphyrinogen IX oxidase
MKKEISHCVVMKESKTLVAFFTKGGATEEYANIIAETLTENGLLVETCNLKNDIPDIAVFDTIILGAGVRMSMVYRRWKKILRQKAIKDKHLYLFLSSGMAADEPDKAVGKYLHPLVEKYGLKPDSLVSFPGKVPEKWAKDENIQKVTMNLDLAKKWAEKIARHVQS